MKDPWYLLIFTCTVMVLTGIMVSVIERGPGPMNFGSLADWFAAIGTILAVGVALFQADSRRREDEKRASVSDARLLIIALVALDDVLNLVRSFYDQFHDAHRNHLALAKLLLATGALDETEQTLRRVVIADVADLRVRFLVERPLAHTRILRLSLRHASGEKVSVHAKVGDTIATLERIAKETAVEIRKRASPTDLQNERLQEALGNVDLTPIHHASPAS